MYLPIDSSRILGQHFGSFFRNDSAKLAFKVGTKKYNARSCDSLAMSSKKVCDSAVSSGGHIIRSKHSSPRTCGKVCDNMLSVLSPNLRSSTRCKYFKFGNRYNKNAKSYYLISYTKCVLAIEHEVIITPSKDFTSL